MAQDYVEDLRLGICKIVFTKNNGDTRTLMGTLLDDYLPEEYKGEAEYQSNVEKKGGAISVWDIEAKDWRAFRPDSVKSFDSITAGTV